MALLMLAWLRSNLVDRIAIESESLQAIPQHIFYAYHELLLLEALHQHRFGLKNVNFSKGCRYFSTCTGSI
jgi:hypothetical protein